MLEVEECHLLAAFVFQDMMRAQVKYFYFNLCSFDILETDENVIGGSAINYDELRLYILSEELYSFNGTLFFPM